MSPTTIAIIAAFVGNGLVVVAFFMRIPIRLRQLSIAANVLLLVFASGFHLWSTLVTNAVLIPLNLLRLRELYATRRAVRSAMATTDLSWEWLRPFMTRRRFAPRQTIFRKGDVASELFFILEGVVRLEDVGVDVSAGAIFGEIAMFSPQRRRMSTAVAVTDTTVLTIGADALAELYETNPHFAVYIVRLITRRLLDDLERNRGSAASLAPDGAPASSLAHDGAPASSLAPAELGP